MSDYWTANGIEKPQQIVVAAACRHPGTRQIAVSARHWDKRMHCQRMGFEAMGASHTTKWEQGFIDQFGEFLTREDALRIAKESGQPLDMHRNGSDTELFSEGLY